MFNFNLKDARGLNKGEYGKSIETKLLKITNHFSNVRIAVVDVISFLHARFISHMKLTKSVVSIVSRAKAHRF